jgi:hypothetical protein
VARMILEFTGHLRHLQAGLKMTGWPSAFSSALGACALGSL